MFKAFITCADLDLYLLKAFDIYKRIETFLLINY